MTGPSPAPGAQSDRRGLPPGYAFKPDWEVTPAYVAERLRTRPDTADFMLLDCRRPAEWETARIEDAVLIPMSEIDRRTDELEPEDGRRDHEIVVHCHHGVRSLRVAATLRGLGFTNVKSMAGGIDAWSAGVDPRVPKY